MIRLLIADDEVETRKGLRNYIPWGTLGIGEVCEANNGQTALEISKQFNPHIVLTDIRMPKLDGISFAKKLKELTPHCKIIFLSGYSDKDYLLSAIHLGAVNYIEKPIDVNYLMEVVGKVVNEIKFEQEMTRRERENLCADLINPVKDIKSVNDRIRLIDLKFDGSCFICLLIKFDCKYENIDIRMKEAASKCIDKRIEGSGYQCLYSFKEVNTVALVIWGQQVHNKTLLEYTLKSLQKDIFCTIDKQVYVGVGNIVNSIEEITNSYKLAEAGMKSNFFFGTSNNILLQNKAEECYCLDNSSVQLFMKLITDGERKAAVLFIRNTTCELRKKCIAQINVVKNYYFNILMSISAVSEKMGIPLADGSNPHEYFWHIISGAGTLLEIEDYVINKIEKYFDQINNKENINFKVYAIRKYINQNYSNPDLSIKDISQYTLTTPNYLSMLFKKETGVTINGYITNLRIEKSKTLLRDINIKLYEVAAQVGYSDPNYYTKAFKRIVGVTPSEYREKELVRLTY